MGSETQSHATGPTLGVRYYVKRGDGSWHVAEIIQKRENPENQRTEFYVHYKECELVGNLVALWWNFDVTL